MGSATNAAINAATETMTEKVGGGYAAELNKQSRDGVTDSDADGGGHREHRSGPGGAVA